MAGIPADGSTGTATTTITGAIALTGAAMTRIGITAMTAIVTATVDTTTITTAITTEDDRAPRPLG